MVPCSSCQRHVRTTDTTCPFCGVSRGSTFTRAFNAFGGAVTAVVLAACYGPPADSKIDDSSPDSAVTDMDADGSPANVDCDDDNASMYPGNTEDCADKLDNDCDDMVDSADSDCVGG